MLVDSHCHIASDLTGQQCTKIRRFYQENDIHKIVLMSSNHIDHDWCLSAYKNIGSDLVVPSFGIHPWYTHLFKYGDTELTKKEHYESVFKREVDDVFLSVLIEPIDFISFFEKNYEEFEREARRNETGLVIGEIGLDKLFKIPNTGYYGCQTESIPTSDIRLTQYRTSMDHQQQIFKHQLIFAFRKNLPVSVHNVKAISYIIDLVRQEYGVSESKIMLHSYTGSCDSLKMLLKYIKRENVFVSVSSLLNKDRFEEINAITQGNVLIESDISIDRYELQLDLLKGIGDKFDPTALNRYLKTVIQ